MESALQTIEQFSHEVVPSLLIPMTGCTLLAPTVSVAEMVPFKQVERVANASDWLLGNFHWRDVPVPLLSFEVLRGQPRPDMDRSNRVAVFNNTGVSDQLPFIALLTQGLPHLARISQGDIAQQYDQPLQAFERMHVSLGDSRLVIPDVAALEHHYLAWQGENSF